MLTFGLAVFSAGILAGGRNANVSRQEKEGSDITLGSEISHPPYNYLNEDGIPTGIDVDLATEAFQRMGYEVKVVQINWEQKRNWWRAGRLTVLWAVFPWRDALTITAGWTRT